MVPSGWKEKTLGEFSDVQRGAGSQYLKYTEDSQAGIRLIRISDFLGDQAKYVERNKDVERFILNENDILIAGTGATAGITFGVPKNFVGYAYSYNAPRIRVNGTVDRNYVLYFLKSEFILGQQKKLFTGNAQPFLDISAIEGFRVHLPPKNEQEKIAKILSTWDEAIEKLENIEKALKHRHFHLRHKFFSNHESTTDLKDVVEIIYGKSPKGFIAEDGRFPIIGTSGVVGRTNSPITSDDTVVLGRKGTLDNPIYVIGPCLPIDTTFWTKAKSDFQLRWVFHLTKYLDLTKYNEASGVPSLSRENLYKIKIPNHSEATQKKIIQILDCSQSEIDKTGAIRKVIQTQKKGLMQQLLTGKKRVKV
jgi:type I restriction enzyme S subunit